MGQGKEIDSLDRGLRADQRAFHFGQGGILCRAHVCFTSAHTSLGLGYSRVVLLAVGERNRRREHYADSVSSARVKKALGVNFKVWKVRLLRQRQGRRLPANRYGLRRDFRAAVQGQLRQLSECLSHFWFWHIARDSERSLRGSTQEPVEHCFDLSHSERFGGDAGDETGEIELSTQNIELGDLSRGILFLGNGSKLSHQF